MPSQNEYSFSIPRHLIEDMAEDITHGVLISPLARQFLQPTISYNNA
jgi:hypothetical protein